MMFSQDQGADVSEDGPEGKKSSSGGEPHIKSAPHFKPATTGDFRKDLGPPSQGGAAPDLRWRTRKWKLRVFPQRAGNRLGAARGPPKAHPGSRTRMTRSHSLGDFFRPPQTLLDASSGADGSTPISRDPWIYQRPPPHSPGPDSWGGSDGAQSGGSAAEERSVHAPARPSLACTPPGWSPALAPGPAPSAPAASPPLRAPPPKEPPRCSPAPLEPVCGSRRPCASGGVRRVLYRLLVLGNSE